nr:hypothetical protein [Pseudomonas sp.]
MTTFEPSRFLRRVLLVDAVLAGGAGVLMAALAAQLQPWLMLPATPMLAAGLGFIAFAVFAAMVARNRTPSRTAVWAVILINAVGAIECAALLMTNMVTPSALGVAFVLALMLVMAVFALLEYAGLRQSPRAADARIPVADRS